MSDQNHVLEVYKTGPLTVVGFGGLEILDQVDIGCCRKEIEELVKLHETKVLAFDLTGVKLVPSGLLGLLQSIRRLGVEVNIYNPSEDVLEVLKVTQLHTLIPVHYVTVKN